MAEVDLQAIHDHLSTLAYRAGARILAANPTQSAAGTKKNSADIVTATDRAVEELVREELRGRWGEGFDFMGEETYKEGDVLGERPTFIVDPIDGTTNFVHGEGYLGLAVDRKPVVGVVYNPFTRTLYSAIRGQGAFLTSPFYDHARLPLRDPEPLTSLSQCLVAVEWGSEREGKDYEVKVETFRRLGASKKDGGAMVHGLRSLGSAELNLCKVAEGAVDLYWENGCYAWDVCAGWVILEEAGGKMVGSMPGDWEPKVEQRRYMAVRGGEGQRGVIEEFWGCVVGRVEVGFDGVS
ncbi:uncharacterized protein LTR77_005434 [Saxophila tyrrhenica]|uniref:Inositol-1-monophosphatase n=1 Tax=Saxophila tyrrhenica TaxID=1690608 RepID=A0AAV9P990_9PEZI|nr:hypothetical protein LTR77_005434 [Saxophila tyrrhenica]